MMKPFATTDQPRQSSSALRLAAIDVGSNAIRFLAAEREGPRRLTELYSARAPVRLGAESFRTGALPPEVMDRAIAALAGFRHRMDSLEIAMYRGVATSAVRDSRNGPEFIDRVWREAGVRLEAITGAEEARLVWRAAQETVEPVVGNPLLVDLGGGSLEVSAVGPEGIRWSESYPLGAVRLLDELGDVAQDERRLRVVLEARMAEIGVRAAVQRADPAMIIAAGGSIEALADLAGREADGRGVRTLPLDRLEETISDLAELTPEERTERLGLRPDRADVILAAAVVYHTVARLSDVEEIVVPEVAVKNGILLDLADPPATDLPGRAPAIAVELRRPGNGFRLACFSDIHGNWPAWRHAVAAARQEGADRIIVAGDLVGDGPFPVEVVSALREGDLTAVRGNVDRKVLKLAARPAKAKKRLSGGRRKSRNRAWTAVQLIGAPDDREWLASLPETLEMEVEGRRVLLVHGSPLGDTDYVYPSITPDALAAKLQVASARPHILVCGHSHIPFAHPVEDVLVVNCGSVGRPADGDPRGSFAIVEFSAETVRARVVRFEYPVMDAVDAIDEREVPGIAADEYLAGTKR